MAKQAKGKAQSFVKSAPTEGWINEPMEAFTSEEATKLFAAYRKARDAERDARRAIAAMISRTVGYNVNVNLDRIDYKRTGPAVKQGPNVGFIKADKEAESFTLEIKRTF